MRTKTWQVSDELWAKVEPLIPSVAERRERNRTYRRKPGGGRKPVYGDRVYFSAILYVLRTGIIWNAFPSRQFGGLSSSALHYRFRLWCAAGFFADLWKAGLAEYDELEGIAWKWQSADGVMQKAPLALESVGRNPTDRGKKGEQKARARRRTWGPVVDTRHRGKRS